MANESNKLITVFTCTYPSEVIVVKGRLQAEGIECYIQNGLTIEVYSLYSNALGGVKLQVKETDYEKAIEILKENETIQKEAVSDSEYKATEGPQCPNCGSFEVSKPKLSIQIIALSILLLGFPLPWMSKSIHCFDCGEDFKLKSDS